MINGLAQQHQLSRDAIRALWVALQHGKGQQAQFNHPELGGMGQWMPGMLMISDMNNYALKAKIDVICAELASAVKTSSTTRSTLTTTMWWLPKLGTPSSSGSQNNIAYAYFPQQQCIAVKTGQQVTYYNTSGRRISGVSAQNQQVFVEADGQRFRIETLPKISF